VTSALELVPPLMKIDRSLYPCVGKCSTTALGDKVCVGCGRLAEDVVIWNTYTDEQKREKTKAAYKRLRRQHESSTIRTRQANPGESNP